LCGHHKDVEDSISGKIVKIQRRWRYRMRMNDLFYGYLDRVYGDYLINGEDTWRDYPRAEICLFDGSCYNIHFLLNHITHSLNSCYMEKPCPKFPRSPYNRVEFTYNELMKVKNLCYIYRIKLHPPAHLFFMALNENTYDYLKNGDNLLDFMMTNLRYMMINMTDSQNNFMGYWVKKNKKKTEFERVYNKFIIIPPYITSDGLLIRNNLWEKTRKKLLSMEKTIINICDTRNGEVLINLKGYDAYKLIDKKLYKK